MPRPLLALLACLAVTPALPATAQMAGMTAQEVASQSGALPRRGQLPRRVQGPTITRLETPSGRTGYTLWGHPGSGGAVFALVALLYASGRDVTGATIDGVPAPGAHAPGGTRPSDKGSAGSVQIPISPAQYARGLLQGLEVEILGAPNLRFTVPRDYLRGYDARYRSVFGG